MLRKEISQRGLTSHNTTCKIGLHDHMCLSIVYGCQRLEIINSNLDFQLKSVNRELKQNIAMLEALEEENKALKEQLKNK